MRTPFTTVLLAACLMPSLVPAQNTAAQPTPQTKAAATAGSSTLPAGQARGSSGASSVKGSRRTHRQHSTTVDPATDASVRVIGSYGGAKHSHSPADTGALPGVTLVHNGLGIAPGTPITLRLQHTINSGQARNGDAVQAVLAQPLGSLPSGAPVDLTVVVAAKAGVVGSGGVLSLQVTRINGEQVLSQVITAQGEAAKTLLPGDAPGIGSEAVFTQDQPITVPAA